MVPYNALLQRRRDDSPSFAACATIGAACIGAALTCAFAFQLSITRHLDAWPIVLHLDKIQWHGTAPFNGKVIFSSVGVDPKQGDLLPRKGPRLGGSGRGLRSSRSVSPLLWQWESWVLNMPLPS